MLETLNLSGCTAAKDLSPVSRLGSLTNLDLSRIPHLRDVSLLSGLASSPLRTLDLSGCTNLTSLEGLSACTQLTRWVLQQGEAVCVRGREI